MFLISPGISLYFHSEWKLKYSSLDRHFYSQHIFVLWIQRYICGDKKSRHHNDIIKWQHFPRYRSFVMGNHQSPGDSPHKGQWLGALMFSLICVWTNGWANNRNAGDFRRHRAHYDVILMILNPYWYMNMRQSLHWFKSWLVDYQNQFIIR